MPKKANKTHKNGQFEIQYPSPFNVNQGALVDRLNRTDDFLD